MVVIVIIGVLAAIAIPNYQAIQEKARQASAKNNLHEVHLSVEIFGTDFGGVYPVGAETPPQGFAYYFPGGDEENQTRPGTYPNNPYTGQPLTAAQMISLLYAASGDNSNNTLGGPNDWVAAGPGLVRYGFYPGPPASPIEYGIIGSRKDRQTMKDRTTVFLLNN